MSDIDSRHRYPVIDWVRGSAVLLMIVFHCAYDLDGFGLVDIDFSKSPFWFSLPRLIVTLFLLCVGVCLAISHKDGIRWPRVKIRFLKIGGWAVVITIVTYVLFPRNFVFFGILHFIAVASLLGVFFAGRPVLSLFLGLGMVVSHLLLRPRILPLSDWLGVNPMDYVPLYPWFGVVLSGIYCESKGLHRVVMQQGPVGGFVGFLGRHSLKIYLIHRPLLFGSVFMLQKLGFSN